ncbi:MAG: putative protein-S-isoprenylcysteine methyltransferase [Gemmatimonadetes bacterium]|nr:putative protein-S-isoprenylcysteine methyltransferase [Gemmatimonadota bacterium]
MHSPIRFHTAPPRSTWRNVLWTAAQCSVVWFVTLFALPLLLVTIERLGGYTVPALRLPVVGACLFLICTTLNLSAGAGLAVGGKGTPLPIAAPRRLFLSGPYRYVRNPMAMAGIGQGIGVGLWLGSWLVIGYAFTGALVWHYLIRPVEEEDLLERFGAEYAHYRACVPLWRPMFPGYASPNLYSAASTPG